jgi:hypothetical protein
MTTHVLPTGESKHAAYLLFDAGSDLRIKLNGPQGVQDILNMDLSGFYTTVHARITTLKTSCRSTADHDLCFSGGIKVEFGETEYAVKLHLDEETGGTIVSVTSVWCD